MEWLNTENLLTVIAVLMGWTNRQNATIQKLLKPLSDFIKVATEFMNDTKELEKKLDQVETLIDETEEL